MSFSAVASCPAKKAYGQGFEELGADFFDQFLTYSLEYGDCPDYSILPASAFHDDSGEASLGSTDDESKLAIAADPWRGEWASKNGASSQPSAPGGHFYEMSGRAAISDTELLSLEGIQLGSPQKNGHASTSLPSSPVQGAAPALRRKNCVIDLSKTFKKASSTIDRSITRSPIKKSSSSNMRTAHSNASSRDLWGQKIQHGVAKFDFDFEQDDAPLSSPSSARVLGPAQGSNMKGAQNGELFNGMTYKDTLTQHATRNTSAYEIPLAKPTLDHYSSRRTSDQQLHADNALFPVTPQAQNVPATWSQLPGSPDFNSYGASSTYPEIDPPVYWNHAAMAPLAQPSPSGFHNPQRANKSHAIQLQNELAYNDDLGFDPSDMGSGIMIQMPTTSAQQSFVVGSPPMQHQQGYYPSPHSQPHHGHHQQRSSRHTSSHGARPRHPQSSPTHETHRTHDRRAERESSESPSPSPTFHVRKRKSNKSMKSNKHSTPRTPTSGAVDFVNYTPSDSRKILTGVAPSGSSKTKARREKEALDKRRKLSQAAVRAVRAAGGDVESLVEQGLFV